MNALEARIIQVAKGKEIAFRLMIGQWPIITCRTKAAAASVLTILQNRYEKLPLWSPVDLLALAGYRANQCVDPKKYRPLAFAWSRFATEQWYLHVARNPAFWPTVEYEVWGGPIAIWLELMGRTTTLRPHDPLIDLGT